MMMVSYDDNCHDDNDINFDTYLLLQSVKGNDVICKIDDVVGLGKIIKSYKVAVMNTTK